MLAGLVDEAEKLGEWVLAARALNNLVQGVPPVGAGRARARCWSGCASTPSGPASSRSRSPRTSRAGPGWPMRDGDLARRDRRAGARAGTATAGTCAAAGAPTTTRSSSPGCYLEAGELDRVEEIIDELRALPRHPSR